MHAFDSPERDRVRRIVLFSFVYRLFWRSSGFLGLRQDRIVQDRRTRDDKVQQVPLLSRGSGPRRQWIADTAELFGPRTLPLGPKEKTRECERRFSFQERVGNLSLQWVKMRPCMFNLSFLVEVMSGPPGYAQICNYVSKGAFPFSSKGRTSSSIFPTSGGIRIRSLLSGVSRAWGAVKLKARAW